MGSGTIAAGIVVGLLASCIQSLGLTMQRKSHVVNQTLPEDEQRSEYRRPLWLSGFAIFLSSNVLGSVFQIASLPVVILAPLGAVSLLWNAFFARILLGDVFSPWMIVGTVLIAGGAVLIGIFGVVPEPTHSLEDLLALLRRPAFILYFSLLGFVIIICLVITHIAEFSYLRRLSRIQEAVTTTALAVPPAIPIDSDERTPLLDRKPPSSSASSTTSASRTFIMYARLSRIPLLLSLSYASISGIVSGMCLVFAKSGVELLLLTIGGDNQFWRWQAWMLLLGLVAFALLQLWYLHKALKLSDPTIVCPLAFCFYNISSIVNGLIYFDQFSLLSTQHLALVIIGIAILLSGVWVVSFQSIGIEAWAEAEAEPTGDVMDEETSHPCAGDDLRTSCAVEEEHVVQAPAVQRRRRTLSALSVYLPEALRDSVLSQQTTCNEALNSTQSTRRSRKRHTLSSELISSTPTPGFSIGLSPVSPGFSLVHHGRSRISNATDGTEEVSPGYPETIRRTVSEGCSRLPLDAEGANSSESMDEGERHATPPDSAPGSQKRQGFWRWLKRVTGS